MIKKLLCALALMITCTAASAAGGGYTLDKAPDRTTNLASLQNGAKLFVNYCLNCHGATAMRYNKLKDIGLTDEQIKESLLFTGDKVGDLMKGTVSVKDGKAWFGVPPPDLSVIARAKAQSASVTGADYIYTYLRTFYRDTTKLTGWNNLAFPNAGMPHVMWERQGERSMTSVTVHEHEAPGAKTAHATWERVTTTYDPMGYTTVKAEALENYRGHATTDYQFKAADAARSAAYDNDVADITAFMTWMSEPIAQTRKQIGVWVMLFLGLFLLVAWRLNASYWKHVR